MGGWQLSPYEIDGDTAILTREASSKFHSNIVNQRFTYAPVKSLSLYAQGDILTGK
ncbi:MAG: hypothetical protein ACLU4J_09650 [Butyricimonas paravirosa]